MEFLHRPKKGKKWSMEKPIRLAHHSSSLLPEDQFLCSICLDVFTDPVTAPCGHNYCKTCLTRCWDTSLLWVCPLCKERFNKRPELKVNTTLRDLADLFKKISPVDHAEVLCDVCTREKQKALKSCLDCGVTFCPSHLEPHNTVQKLRKHKLINPVKNVEVYVCQKHEKPLELFCRDDQEYVCQFCTEADHKNHNTIPLEEIKQKSTVRKARAQVQEIIGEKLKKISEIKQSVKLSRKNTERERANSAGVFTALLRSIERTQAELPEMMKKEQEAAEREAQEFVEELEQEIAELQKKEGELEQLLHTDQHLHLLQVYPSACKPPPSKDWTDVGINTNPSGETVRTALSQLQKNLNKKLSELQNEKLRETVSTELKRIRQYAADVTLDPETAHPILVLSADGKEVRRGDATQNLPDSPERFTYYSIVLGKPSFSSGRFYYEVRVGGKLEWELGVALESVNRKGEIVLKPENGLWTLVLRNGKNYMACDDCTVHLSLKEKLQRTGVFVDYEEGLVSFYDVENRSHIYTFTGQSFPEKLYPYFWPGPDYRGRNLAPLIICPVQTAP